MDVLAPQEFNLQSQFSSNLPDVPEEIIAEGLELHDLKTRRGWEVVREYIEGRIEELDNVNVNEGDTAETVGYRFLACKTAKVHLKAVIDLVEEAYEAIERKGNE